MSVSQEKSITALSVTLLVQQAFHDVMDQTFEYDDPEDGTYCVGESVDVGYQAEQIALQFQALLYAALGIEGGPGAIPSLPPSQWRQ